MSIDPNAEASKTLSDSSQSQSCAGCKVADAPGGAEGCWYRFEIPFGIGADCFYKCAGGGFHHKYEPINGCSKWVYLV